MISPVTMGRRGNLAHAHKGEKEGAVKRYYESLPYEEQVAPRRRQFHRLLAREVRALKKVFGKLPHRCDEVLARSQRIFDKYEVLRQELKEQLDRTMPLPPALFEADVFRVFRCPLVLRYEAPEVDEEDLAAFDRWCGQFDVVKRTVKAAKKRGEIEEYVFDDGPLAFDGLRGPTIVGVKDEDQARLLQRRLARKVGAFVLETARARPRPQPLKRSAEGEARIHERMSYGYMKLRIEPWRGLRHLFLDLRDPRHNHLDDNVRGIFEGVWYAASFGLEFGRPICPVKIEVLDEEIQTPGSWDMLLCDTAAAAFRDAARRALA